MKQIEFASFLVLCFVGGFFTGAMSFEAPKEVTIVKYICRESKLLSPLTYETCRQVIYDTVTAQ